jgi:uncharacterized membrane protein YeaQ/YmgE (transglycosylase-associated protein family)
MSVIPYSIESIIMMLIIGAVAGWAAGQIMKERSLGLLGNIVVGIIGSVVGGKILSMLHIYPSHDFFGTLVSSVLGAVVVLWVVNFIKSR